MSELLPPIAKKLPFEITSFGESRIDNWHWLQDETNPEVIEYLNRENEYFKQRTSHLAPLQDKIFKEILSRISENKAGPDTVLGNYKYVTREIKSKPYPIFTRFPATLNLTLEHSSIHPQETVIFDQNTESEGKDYYSLGCFELSISGNFLIYSYDISGRELYTVKIRDLQTFADLTDLIPKTSGEAVWSKNEDFLFYLKPDDQMRPSKLYRHKVGTNTNEDTLVYEESDESFYLNVSVSKSNAWIILDSSSKTTSETWVLDSSLPLNNFQRLIPRTTGVEYHIEHISRPNLHQTLGLNSIHIEDADEKGAFILLTNHEALNFKLLIGKVHSSSFDDFKEFIKYEKDLRLVDFDVLYDAVVIEQRGLNGKSIKVVSLKDLSESVIMPETKTQAVSLEGNLDFYQQSIRIRKECLGEPDKIVDINLEDLSTSLKWEKPVFNIDFSKFEEELIFAKSYDETHIPISLIKPRDFEYGPMLLYAYGAYEISIDPWFSEPRFSLLERGVAFAIAHVRGGGELGRGWYEEGRLSSKKNTFFDLISVANYLLDQRLCAPNSLVIRGGSAGGLTVGASINMAPDLFKGAIAEVPFLDVLNTMSDVNLPLTVTEWDEWGNPLENINDYQLIKSYAPYENINEVITYPNLYVTAGLNDPRVGYHEPAKFVQKLRDANVNNDAILKIEMGAGHAGPSDRYEKYRQEALILSWVLDQVGKSDYN